MREALLYDRLENDEVKCHLCHHRCRIPPGKTGICGVRKNERGVLYTLVYGEIIARHVDPIEKKPLFHFLPGTLSYSIATVGCNFQCDFCQNFEISQFPRHYGYVTGEKVSPERVVEEARRSGSRSISYTYTEPTVYFEFALDCARLAEEAGLKNVFVSNGYMTPEALETIYPHLHAANIDLKSFREEFYRRHCRARLKPVLETLRHLKRQGVWLEVTTLIIPGENDDPEELRDIASFIKEDLGPETPWHVTRFYPTYRLLTRPPTPIETLHTAYAIGRKEGLKYVYTGNIPGDRGENTYCWSCEHLLIERYGFRILKNEITEEGTCPRCGARQDGHWA
ncbi:AmmeMemoRadiSam system radical SAM enzyme [Thermosulfurimonas sp. F29]|uniref:AmmeMemoRadiSam system radical SAM enzyme n=1 Tax=Thermosulfurimonas sp. F29 TaxID=2867247 RepID=UPI001C83187E|nr:AmmeMemoRadiSam system radical SAM enzyme [Thermosulfurimonas sp. F29]MBX6423717.1 AmmeMemoRadiSam system radical SAM enzyme [Thermosulfurimonas sp. F29]